MAKVPNTDDNRARCLCADCPSYPGEGDIFYCVTGKSATPIVKRGCICGDCAVFKEYALQDGYYCVAGVAGEEAE